MNIVIKSFEDICKYQAILDSEISKVRNNGFIPKERSLDKIVLSAIAECIEFNEETEETHKTWKQKEFNKKNELEELTDIVFFIAQFTNLFINNLKKEYRNIGVDCVSKYFKRYDQETERENDCILNMINSLSRKDITSIIINYCVLVDCYGYTHEEIFKEYERKWKINMTRINKDWSL